MILLLIALICCTGAASADPQQHPAPPAPFKLGCKKGPGVFYLRSAGHGKRRRIWVVRDDGSSFYAPKGEEHTK